ncbi:MAG TPA: phosphoserine phosphatase SerB [Candidatus Aphodousia faecavium]|nr:phosphoserine phosphatase SerB [Candidatus Aphodousia faecavium]
MDIVIQGKEAQTLAQKLTLKNIWVKPDAIRVNGVDDVISQQLIEEATKLGLDVNCLPDGLSIKDFGIVTLDMDSTLIELECIDDIAWQYGVGEEVARMTEIAMQGHMPFAEYLRERVALFKDAPAHFVDVTASHAKLMPGAREFIDFAKKHGLKTYILSGGFDTIAKHVCEMLGMSGYLCNRLIIEDGKLTGEVTGPGGGEILDAAGKRRALDMLCMLHGILHDQAIAGGDGANDLEMIKAAGVGFAYHGKPIVAASAPYRVNHGGLDVVMNFFVEAWDEAKKD